MSEEPPDSQQTDEELRAQLDEELKRIHVRDVLLQTVVSLVNLGFQRLGLTAADAEAAAEVRDLEQARLAIEGVRALLPLLEAETPTEISPVRDALSQLQMAYAQVAGPGAAPVGGEPGQERPEAPAEERREAPASGPEEPPPKPKPSGRLWTPPGSSG